MLVAAVACLSSLLNDVIFLFRIHFANTFYPYCGKDGSPTDQGIAFLPTFFLDFLSFLTTHTSMSVYLSSAT